MWGFRLNKFCRLLFFAPRGLFVSAQNGSHKGCKCCITLSDARPRFLKRDRRECCTDRVLYAAAGNRRERGRLFAAAEILCAALRNGTSVVLHAGSHRSEMVVSCLYRKAQTLRDQRFPCGCGSTPEDREYYRSGDRFRCLLSGPRPVSPGGT